MYDAEAEINNRYDRLEETCGSPFLMEHLYWERRKELSRLHENSQDEPKIV